MNACNYTCKHSFCQTLPAGIIGVGLCMIKHEEYKHGEDGDVLKFLSIPVTQERWGRFKNMHSVFGGAYEAKDVCPLTCAMREYLEEVCLTLSFKSDRERWAAFDKVFKLDGAFKYFMFNETLILIGKCDPALTHKSFKDLLHRKSQMDLSPCYNEILSIEFIEVTTANTRETFINDYSGELSERPYNPSSYLEALLRKLRLQDLSTV